MVDEDAAEAAAKELDRLRTAREGPDYLIKKLDALIAQRNQHRPNDRLRPGRYLIQEVP
jgi:hypothetical protein